MIRTLRISTTDALVPLAADALVACGAARPADDGPHATRTPVTGGSLGAVPASVAV
eukprot:gene27081-48588_t